MKTKIVMFTWNYKVSLRRIKMGNNNIALSDSAKFLGVTLDSKLNFKEHINKTVKKSNVGKLVVCRCTLGEQLGHNLGHIWGTNSTWCTLGTHLGNTWGTSGAQLLPIELIGFKGPSLP